ncbi:hypothetical protein ACFWDA_06610 [Rhodococcus zopfii]|uniref:Uncharacterized protein n=1 Tax=Rhodococcus zopfii TaxID=43772 RepID=A0ABU3WNR3_9NOCA|nr:hypothetical protein [Rhodococcus zopfii]MDV2475073.1 hypothetical protein [Rhodococcus zopfii]
MDRMATWWDGFELWLAGLSFVPQAALVLLVMVPLCAGAAWLLDRLLAAVFAAVGRGEPETPAPATTELTTKER